MRTFLIRFRDLNGAIFLADYIATDKEEAITNFARMLDIPKSHLDRIDIREIAWVDEWDEYRVTIPVDVVKVEKFR